MIGYFFICIFAYHFKTNDMYIAVAITHDDYWVLVSKPCTKEEAEKFRGCQLPNETFDVKTQDEVNNHKKVVR